MTVGGSTNGSGPRSLLLEAPARTADPSGRGLRLDIQGLRALAVLLVVVHHLGGLGLPGGYVGVDVFFVLSGYLITGLLLRDVQRHGRVSVTMFYARRARRILPAATLVSAVTLVVSLVTLPLVRTQDLVVDAFWATTFAANVRFASVGTDYFARGEPPSPLQHFWSLAVEEQFYLIWPLLVLAVAVAVTRRGGGEVALTRALWVMLLVVLAASLAWSVRTTTGSPITAYFSTFARAWELGAGAACALVLQRGPMPLTRGAREPLVALGLVAIAASALVYTPQTDFPGVAAALPVLGTVAVVLTGGRPGSTTLAERALSIRPAVLVGAWSFSVYLWHWPAIIVAREVSDGPLGPVDKALLLAAVLVLSWLTYRVVETPFREHAWWRRTGPALAIYPLSIVLVAVTAAGTGAVVGNRLAAGGGAPIALDDDAPGTDSADPYVGLVAASASAAREDRAIPGALVPGLAGLGVAVAPLGDCDYRTGTRELCAEGDASAERSIVVLGDSYARALSPAIDWIGSHEGYRVYTLVYSGCMATGLVQIERDTEAPWTECEDFKAFALETITDLAPDQVIVATHAVQVVDPATGEGVSATGARKQYLPLLEQGYEMLLTSLEPLTDRVAVVANTPYLPFEPATCLSREGSDLGDCAHAPQRLAEVQSEVLLRAARDTGADAVDAGGLFCHDDLCPSVIGPFLPLRDREHMTPDYARFIAPSLAVRLGLSTGSVERLRSGFDDALASLG